MKSSNNFSMAMTAISAARWRSFLTTLGIIIGVASVVTVVSLGEGVKHQLTAETKRTGQDLITVRGGRLAEFDQDRKVKEVHLFNLFAGTTLSDTDYQIVQTVKGLQLVSPFALVSGVPKTETVTDTRASVIATNDKAAQALNQPVQYGAFYGASDSNQPVAVIGRKVAEELFKESVPIGKTFEFRGKTFNVVGIFQQFGASPLTPGIDYNNSIFIPYDYAKGLAPNAVQPYQILVRPQDESAVTTVSDQLGKQLADTHGGQVDFTVLRAADSQAVANSALNVVTTLVSAVAAISLLVGGIGIMNIMLVNVSERTHEIGVRKSIGATNRQIMGQFVTEAIVLSGVGGVLGVILSLLINYFLRILTSLQPVVTLPVMGVAIVVALIVGTFFGMTPALKAARKDPIESLRRG